MSGDLCASVIIPCYRADDVLPLQLEALTRQVEAPPFEVILVDNGGNRDLKGLAAEVGAKLPNLRVVDATHRRGAGYARNVGIGAARAERLLFCDADDVVMPEWVNFAVQQLEEAAVFSGGAVPVTEHLCSQGWAAVVEHVGPHEEPTSALALSGSANYPILMGGSFGIWREIASELGGFDLSFGSAAEDNDLAFRLVVRGHQLPDAGHVCIAYRIRDNSGSFRRGFRSAMGHAMLCARHNAWRCSQTYSGKWPARPIRTLLRPLLEKGGRGSLGAWRDALGRDIGALVGWLRYRGGFWMPETELGAGIDWGRAFR